MTRLQQWVAHCETVPGATTILHRVDTIADFRALLIDSGALLCQRWTKDDETGEPLILEWFERVKGRARIHVECLRGPTVRDWTEKQQAEKRDERKAAT